MKRHIIVVAFSQNAVKITKKKDGSVSEKPVRHFVEFTEEVDPNEIITSTKLSDYLIGRLLNYQQLQQLQGKKDKFDTSLGIDMTIKVDDNVRSSSIKFSTNPTTLARTLEKYPTAVAMVFDPKQLGWGTSRETMLQYAKGIESVIAKALPAEETKEESLAGQMPLLNTENIEEAEVVDVNL